MQTERLWVGLSGGRDSVVLLHALNQIIPGRLSAIHVHHGLSPNADRWAEFCQTLCASLGIPLLVSRVSLDQAGIGTEGAARHARYRAFAELGAVPLCLAHHQDDQAETVLFNLLRGAGVHGLAAMREERPHGGLRILRPLLGLPRCALESYAAAQQLLWIEDESNRDTRFSRNFLRQDILPKVQARFPAASNAISRAAAHMAEAAELLDALARGDRQTAVGGKGGIVLASFCSLGLPRQKNLLRHWLREYDLKAPDSDALAELVRQLSDIATDNHFVFQLEGASLRCWQGEIHLVQERGFLPGAPECWQGEAFLPWAGGVLRFEHAKGMGISRLKLAGMSLLVRTRQGGDTMSLGPKRPSRPIKKLLQEAQLAPWLRDQLPILVSDEAVVWCHGVGVAAPWQAGPDEAGILPCWLP